MSKVITEKFVTRVNNDGSYILGADGTSTKPQERVQDDVPFDSTGRSVDLVESLPSAQIVITPNDSTVVDIMGLECLVSGTVAVKFTNDAVAFTRTVVAGQIIYGRIVAVMATGTSLVQSELIGLK